MSIEHLLRGPGSRSMQRRRIEDLREQLTVDGVTDVRGDLNVHPSAELLAGWPGPGGSQAGGEAGGAARPSG